MDLSSMATRRLTLGSTIVGLGAAHAVITGRVAFAATLGTPAAPAPLLDGVAAVCRRLAPLGWRQLLLDATGGELDLGATDLGPALARPLRRIDRTCPGFGDFAAAGVRAVEPGEPDLSLLYHALASPTVVDQRNGAPLGGFPTLAEIEAVENYVYGARPPTLDQLRGRAKGRPLGVAVFALQYR